jgi:hypothetical protein
LHCIATQDADRGQRDQHSKDERHVEIAGRAAAGTRAELAPTNSATIAPVAANTIETLKPPKMWPALREACVAKRLPSGRPSNAKGRARARPARGSRSCSRRASEEA